MTTQIRIATSQDRDAIRDIHLRAFPESENQLIATLASNLLDEKTKPEIINLVAESGGNVVGHVTFSPVFSDANTHWRGYILAPLAVKPEYQKAGIGTQLVTDGLERLTQQGVNVVLVYGDPDYYTRFGFSADEASRIQPPYTLKYPFGWLARALNKADSSEKAGKIYCVSSLNDPALW